MHSIKTITALIATATAFGALGCASSPPAPTANIQAAQQAIASAERVEAGRFAAGDLGSARTKLAAADTAVGEKQMVLAARYADESRADAELAAARTVAAKANTVNEDMKRSTGALVEEMNRRNGAKQ
jgi:uncharacterized protein DUF4398